MSTLKQVDLRGNMKSLLSHIGSLKIINSSIAERAFSQYSDLLATAVPENLEKFKNFDSQRKEVG